MRKFKLDKLVRDKIKDRIISQGNTPNWHKLSDEEYIFELKKKILEEANEILESPADDLVNEIADLQEIINAIVTTVSSKKLMTEILKAKRAKNGVYMKKIYIDSIEAKDDSKWINYYLKSPSKFPEIK